jgi:ubiquinone/menaquinone biosynthesis C-methylase UbiE
MLRAIADWAKDNNKQVQLIGVDRNPVMTNFAGEKSTGISNIEFIAVDVFDDRLLEYKADFIMCTLFCHHFDDDKLVELIKRMHQLAAHTVIVNDLDRHWFAYYSFKVISKIFSGSHLVKYDGPLSVARSLTKKEWTNILTKSKITNYTLVWKWAWRWQLIIQKESHA